jgi:hypothetical protein
LKYIIVFFLMSITIFVRERKIFLNAHGDAEALPCNRGTACCRQNLLLR